MALTPIQRVVELEKRLVQLEDAIQERCNRVEPLHRSLAPGAGTGTTLREMQRQAADRALCKVLDKPATVSHE